MNITLQNLSKKGNTNKQITKKKYSKMFTFDLFCSLEEIYGRVFSLKLGGHKCVIASTPEAVHEMLVKKSADYAGRPKTYSIEKGTLGR